MIKHLFRGFAQDVPGETKIDINGNCYKGTWRYGYLTGDNLINGSCVIGSTVSEALQFTTTDGKNIFPGDIVQIEFSETLRARYIIWYHEEAGRNIAIRWDEGDDKRAFFGYPVNYGYKDINDQWDNFAFAMNDPYGDGLKFFVIGNVFENPEMVYISEHLSGGSF